MNTPRGTSRSSSIHAQRDAVSAFPFRSSSNHAGVPPREWSFTPSHRSPSQLSVATSVVPQDAMILKRRDVNSIRHRTSLQQANEEASLQRVVGLRYEGVTAAGTKSFPKLLRRASAANRGAPIAEGTVSSRALRLSPELVWLHVKPSQYTASSLPVAVLTTVASYLDANALVPFRAASKSCATAAAEVALVPISSHPLDTTCSAAVPAGYLHALSLVEEGFVDELQWTTVTMMAILLIVSGETANDVLRVAHVTSAVLALWKQRFASSEVDLDVLLSVDQLRSHRASLEALFSLRCSGKAPQDIDRKGELEDPNAAVVVSRVMKVVEWNTEAF